MSTEKFGETTGLKYGDRIVVTYEGISAGASYVAGLSSQMFSVILDGTGQMVTVPGYTIKKEKA